MKKIFGMLIILAILYIGIQLGFRFFGKGHLYDYQVNTDNQTFSVKEKFITNTKNEIDNYYFEISKDNSTFYYQAIENFNKADHIIKDIYSYSDNEYSCILPVFIDNKIISDVMCQRNNTIYFYQNIKGSDLQLDLFVDTLKEYGYEENSWIDSGVKESENKTGIYKANVINDHYVALANYKGVYLLNNTIGNKISNIKLFDSDIYKRPISLIFNKYYITANYNEQYRFTKFYVVDLTSNKSKEINCGREISFDSYIQGTDDNSIYLFDRDSKIQYEINLKTGTVLEVGNENTNVKIYRNGEWKHVSAILAKNNTELFDSKYKSDIIDNKYERIDKVGNKDSGYYYFYKKENSNYLVYRSNVQNIDQLTYLFTTNEINRINYQDKYIYYIDGSSLKYYTDSVGIRNLLTDSELEYNQNLIYGVYQK